MSPIKNRPKVTSPLGKAWGKAKQFFAPKKPPQTPTPFAQNQPPKIERSCATCIYYISPAVHEVVFWHSCLICYAEVSTDHVANCPAYQENI